MSVQHVAWPPHGADLEEGSDALIAQPDALELLPHAVEQWAPVGQRVHELAQRCEVLQGVEALHQHVAALGLGIVLSSLGPLVAVAVVLACRQAQGREQQGGLTQDRAGVQECDRRAFVTQQLPRSYR